MKKLSIFLACLLGGLFAIGMLTGFLIPKSAIASRIRAADEILPDLVVALEIEPSLPQLGEQVSVTLSIENQGTAVARDFCTYLFVDPITQPPTADTPFLYDNCLYAGLYPGYSYSWTKYVTFDITGTHYVSAWVDRDNAIAESDESNNRDSQQFEILDPSSGWVDTYEYDSECAAARLIASDGVHHHHTLWPIGDQDWVRVDMAKGVTYVITTQNVGEDVDTKLQIYDYCDQAPLAGDAPALGQGAVVVWTAMSTGPHYVQVEHNSPTYGADTHYDIAVDTQVTGDAYEPDSVCVIGREVVVDGSKQDHLFHTADDQDWVWFQATVGQAYEFVFSDLGTTAQPQIELHRNCGDTAILSGAAQDTGPWTCEVSGLYRLGISNSSSAAHGSSASYGFQIATVVPPSDPGEPDDKPTDARQLPTDGTAIGRRLAPGGDYDWFYFDAIVGQTYRIETFDLDAVGDTVLCLYDSGLSEPPSCDDDGGPGLASRLVWTCSETGRIYLRVRDYRQDAGGSSLDYQISLMPGAGVCDDDQYESDDHYYEAAMVLTDGTPHYHHFCPDYDEDWLRFWLPSSGTYMIETNILGSDADTVVTLYDTDAQTILWTNDDWGSGRMSQIIWHFDSEGVYYVKIEPYGKTGSGRGTEYTVSVSPSATMPTPTPTVTPTPQPTATPTPTPTPQLTPVPPSSARTLILTHRGQLESQYGASATDATMASLRELANSESVLGVLVDVGGDAATAAAYAAWLDDQTSVSKANSVTDAVRNIVLRYHQQSSNLGYLVLVGNDLVLPFRRVQDRPDLTRAYESAYDKTPSSALTIRAAQQANMSLSDDYYACLAPQMLNGSPVYVPDLAVGRLVETPADITASVGTYLAEPVLDVERTLVVGYGDFERGSSEICSHWQSQGVAGVDCALVGGSWSATDLQARHLNAVPRYDLQALGVLTNHYIEGAADSASRTYAEDILDASSDFQRTLIWTLGAQGGLNIPGSSDAELDLPEAFSRLGSAYIGNTGTTFTHPDYTAYADRLMLLLAQELSGNMSIAIGDAWRQAKRRFFWEAPSLTEYDRKVLSVATLYGMPMTLVHTGQNTLGEELFGSVGLDITSADDANALVSPISLTLSLELDEGIESLRENRGHFGDYYDLDGHTYFSAGEAAQPYYYSSIAVLGEAPRSLLWTGGVYTDMLGFTPVVIDAQEVGSESELVASLAAGVPSEPEAGWERLFPVVSHELGYGALAINWGQYSDEAGLERLYSDLTFDAYFSDSTDRTPPTIDWVAARVEGMVAKIKIAAHDDSEISRVVLVYTYNDGVWRSKELAYDPTTAKWLGTVLLSRPVDWFAEVLDRAGNKVTVVDKAHYYHAETVETLLRTYLPLILR